MRLRRGPDRRGGAAAPEPPWALLSFLLRYPDARVVAAREDIAAAVEEVEEPACRTALRRFLAGWTGDAQELAAHYVATFDLRRRASLELTYYAHGDTRERGMALLRLKKLYRAAGLPLDCPELPDHLTVMLAFAELAPPGHGAALLAEHGAAIELLRLSLHDLGTPYAHLLDAVVAGLPPLGVDGRAEVARLAREGPPEEAVGLEPYGPPEAMPEGARA
ncbi:MAG TPA: nitrate reductase molybdenum cofactor assembly chaperone [Baekduia sp.]|nr:nitrate reductase molybdenum cofactor assembly chaperone [Baekduia sp.]